MTLLLILLSISVRNRTLSTGLCLERSKARGLGLCGGMHVTWNLELFEFLLSALVLTEPHVPTTKVMSVLL